MAEKKIKEATKVPAKVTIDGKEYEIENLNDIAKNQLSNLRVADQRIAQLQMDLSITQTARSVYAKILSENLPKE
jgi:hypothetical protein